MGFLKTTSKWKATKAFINVWLKDKTRYCSHCGTTFFDNFDEENKWIPCCEEPQIGDNSQHTAGVIKENQMIKKSRAKDTAATASGHMRLGLSLPPALLIDLEIYFKKNYNEKFLNDIKEMRAFMREFPMFTICKKI